jgi:sugar fermentation stimulation protein A
VAAGQRAILVLCAQRADARRVAAAADIDPGYAAGLRDAARAGVVCLGLRARVTTSGVAPDLALPVVTDSEELP